MLPLIERLKRPGLFTRAYSARKMVTTSIFTLYVLPRHEKAPKTNVFVRTHLPMVGFVVSKKTCKSAYRRNKMKRRLREAYRVMQKTYKMGKNNPLEEKSPALMALSRLYVMVLVI